MPTSFITLAIRIIRVASLHADMKYNYCFLAQIITCICLLGACKGNAEPEYTNQFFAFGTIIDITIYGMDKDRASAASGQIEQIFLDIHKSWHAWQESDVTRLNESIESGLPVVLDPDLALLLKKSIGLGIQSEGLFNPAIGKLAELWGFHNDEMPAGSPPDYESIQGFLQTSPDIRSLVLDENKLVQYDRNIQLDFGGIAKGFAIDIAIGHLRDLGINNAIVNAGGDLRGIGRHGNRPWNIGIRSPRGNGILASLSIDGDYSIFTSGDFERFYEYEGKRYHHILEPCTGYPAVSMISATVMHTDAATADAAATALFIAGPEHWYSVAREMGIRYVMLVDSDGKIHMNPAMAKKIHFEIEPIPEIALSPPLQ